MFLTRDSPSFISIYKIFYHSFDQNTSFKFLFFSCVLMKLRWVILYHDLLLFSFYMTQRSGSPAPIVNDIIVHHIRYFYHPLISFGDCKAAVTCHNRERAKRLRLRQRKIRKPTKISCLASAGGRLVFSCLERGIYTMAEIYTGLIKCCSNKVSNVFTEPPCSTIFPFTTLSISTPVNDNLLCVGLIPIHSPSCVPSIINSETT